MSTKQSSKGAASPSAKRTVSAEKVCDMLARCLSKRISAETPDEEQVSHLTDWINLYIKAPITPQIIHEIAQQGAQASRDRKLLKQAAAILSLELDSYRTHGYEHDNQYHRWVRARVANLELAIRTLDSPGFIDFGGTVPKRRGPDPKPWPAIARRIAKETVLAMQAAGDGRKTAGGADGPIIRFVEDVLKLILNEEDLPASREAIREVLEGRSKR